MPKRSGSRIYWRGRRAYADLRDLGGKREALIPDGETRATTDPDVAAALVARRVVELEEEAQNRSRAARDRALGIRRSESPEFATYAARHLRKKAEGAEVGRTWLAQEEKHLAKAVEFFGGSMEIGELTPADMTRLVEHLRRTPNERGRILADSSIRKLLNSISSLYRRALSEGVASRNPVADMYSKPTEKRGEAAFLGPQEAARLLEAGRTYLPPGPEVQKHGGAILAGGNPYLFPILATALLTGGRKAEVLGLEVDDVSFRLGKVYFRTNSWRRLKTRRSERSVPLWPQLEEILRAYLQARERSGGVGRLLFPSVGGRPRQESETGNERMITDLRKGLDRVAVRAGFRPGQVRFHMLRHTYTAARIQTLDRGAPVSLYTVARELGHSSTSMIEQRYGHLHDRALLGGAEVVEFVLDDQKGAPKTGKKPRHQGSEP